MDQDQLRSLFENVRDGAVDIDSALTRMRHMPFEDLGFAKVDHHRALRHGMPEVILAQGKTPEQIVAIAGRLLENSPNVLITRVVTECAHFVSEALTGGEYFPLSGVMRFWRDRSVRGKGTIAVVCAGTSDIPVAEEAQLTAEIMGNRGGYHLRHRRGRHPPPHAQSRAADGSARCGGLRRHGGRATQRGRRIGIVPGNSRTNQCGLRRQFQRPWPRC